MSNKYTQQIVEEQVDMTCSRVHPVPMKPTVNDCETYWWWNIALAAGMTALLVGSAGCYAGGVDPATFEFVDIRQQPAPFAPACHDTFAPEENLTEVTRWALNKWEAVTGKTLCIDSTGVPIVRVPEVWVDNESMCGNTNTAWGAGGQYLFTNYIELSEADLGCVSEARVLLHEIGHAIAHHPFGAVIHTTAEQYGVMQARSNSATNIDAPSVFLVCANSDCPALEPLQAHP